MGERKSWSWRIWSNEGSSATVFAGRGLRRSDPGGSNLRWQPRRERLTIRYFFDSPFRKYQREWGMSSLQRLGEGRFGLGPFRIGELALFLGLLKRCGWADERAWSLACFVGSGLVNSGCSLRSTPSYHLASTSGENWSGGRVITFGGELRGGLEKRVNFQWGISARQGRHSLPFFLIAGAWEGALLEC